VNVSNGGLLSSASYMDIGVGAGTTGTLTVDGSASAASANTGLFSVWGSAAGQATVTFSNGATGTFGIINMAVDNQAGTSANVLVQTGAHLNTGTISMATFSAPISATLNVQGAGSTVTQFGLSSVDVGHSAAGNAAINIGTTASGAVFTTGAGSTTISKTGTVTVGSTTSTGALVANGDVSVFGGTLQVASGSVVSIAAGKTMTISNTGKVKGSGTITGSVVNHVGTVAPGLSPGSLSINGNYTQNALGILEIEIASLTSFDRLLVNGTASLGGTLAVSLSYSPTYGSTFDILDWTTRSGTFATLQLPALSGGLEWNTTQLYTNGVLSVALPGDYNFDSTVDAADYVVWRKGIGIASTPENYNLWRTNFGRSASGGSASNATAPEPTAALLLVLGAALGCWRTTPTCLARSKTYYV
jgi:hypothetical protein